MSKTSIIRSIYLYVVTLIGLMMIAFPVGSLVDAALKTWVFPNATEFYYECAITTPRPIVAPAEPKADESATPTLEEEQARCEKNKEIAKENETRHRQSRAVRDISFLIVGIPLFLFHFRIVQRERKEQQA